MNSNNKSQSQSMEQLQSMGFSQDQASRALAATSTLEQATNWLLSNPNPNPNPNPKASFNQLFKRPKTQEPSSPLSERMRPSSITQVLGQDHLLSPNSTLASALARGHLPSLVLWGPPGSGKTSIARAVARALPASPPHRFVSVSAVTSSVKDIREAIENARRARKSGTRTVLFVDEVHRFSKTQLDAFLPAIEDGSIIFIGATTENPSFHLTTPLLSRSRVLALEPLKPQHVKELLHRAVSDTENGLGVPADEEALAFLSVHCDGDARVALNALEVAATISANRNTNNATITINDAKEVMQCKHLSYDRDGEEHYNLISALHKSMRGNDANAAIYWLARMLEAGEQPLYIARRLVRFASEDVGLADPAALPQAIACYQACHFLGIPECDVNLAQCVAYLALAPKSVAVYKALSEAKRAVKESKGGNESVPLHLRNAPTKLMKEFGYGDGYIYTPEDPEGSKSQSYLPQLMQGCRFLDWPPQE